MSAILDFGERVMQKPITLFATAQSKVITSVASLMTAGTAVVFLVLMYAKFQEMQAGVIRQQHAIEMLTEKVIRLEERLIAMQHDSDERRK